MMALIISIISLLIQSYVVFVAIRLLQMTRHRVAWGCIALGMSIILFRRVFELAAYFDLNDFEPNITYTLISLSVSISMAVGMHLAKRMIDRMMESNERLSASEAYYRGLMDFGTEAIFIIDGQGRYQNANQRALDLTGYTLDHLTRLSVADILDPEEVARIPIKWEELRSGNLLISHRRCVKANGEIFVAELHSLRLPDGNFMSSVRDITAHYQAIDKLRFQANLLDTVQQSVVAFDLNGRATYCNKFAENMFGWSGRQVIGATVADLLSSHAEFEVCQQIQQNLESGQRWTGELRYQDASGTPASVMLVLSPLFAGEGNQVGSIAVAFDMTELQAAEQAAARAENLLREFVDTAPFGAHHYELKPDGSLVFVGANLSAERILHFDHAHLCGKQIEEAFPSLRETSIPDNYRSVALTGVPWESSQVRYNDGIIDGAFEVSAFQTGTNRMVALFKDVTDRYRAEEALRQREIRLQTINDIARGISDLEPVESIVERTLMSIFQAYPQYRVAYCTVDRDNVLHFARSLQPSGRKSLTGTSFDLKTVPQYLEQLQRGEILAISSLSELVKGSRGAQDSADLLGLSAVLAAPLHLNGQLVGSLGFDCHQTAHWTEYEMKLLIEVAGYLQIALRDAHLREVRLHAEDALRESEEQFRLALRNSPVIMFRQDRDLRYIWNYNPTTPDLNQYIIGKTDHDILPPELADRLVAIKRDVMASGVGQRFETNIEFMGKTTYWDCTIEPLTDRLGNVAGVTGISSEITGRKQIEIELRNSEERFKALADNLPAYVWTADTRGGVTYFNRRALEALGESFEKLSGYQWLSRVHPDDRPGFEQLLANSLAACLPFEYTFRVRDFRDEYRHVINRGVPQFNAAGELTGYVGSCFDISEQLESELHLTNLVSKLRIALQAASSGTFEYDIKKDRINWSDEMLKLYGIPAKEFNGKFTDWTDRLIPEERQETLAKLAMDVARGGGMRNEFRIQRLDDGEIRWIEARGELQRDSDGNPERMIGVNIDITERKRVEEGLRHAEFLSSRMRAAFLELNRCETLESTLEPLLQAAFDLAGLTAGGIYLIRGEMAELVHDAGLPLEFRQAVVMMPLNTPHVKQVLHSQRPVYLPTEVPALSQMCEQCGIWHIYSFPLRSGRGEVFGFLNLASFAKLPPAEQNVQALETLVSEVGIIFHRLRAEEALAAEALRRRILINESFDGIVTLDPDGKVWESNRRFAEMLGYSPEEIRTLHVWDWDTQWNREQLLEMIEQSGPEGAHFETEHRRKDGTTYPVEISTNGAAFENQKLVLCVCRDISERKAAEAERAALETQLRTAQRLETVGTMAAGIAHDFNNLLVPIIGYTELVSSDKHSGRFASDYLQEVLKAAYRAKGLVSHILAFSRQQTGERRPMQIESIIAGVVESTRRMSGENIVVRYSASGQTTPVLGDPLQISQILTNLCENAVQAMDKGGELQIDATNLEATPLTCPHCKRRLHEKMVHVRVTDTGCGMDEMTIKRIFDPFFTTKGVGKGTGLGLAVVHGIVTQHSGHVCAESILGKGTTFHLLLPAAGIAAPATDVTLPIAVEGGHESVLIIDDEPSVANSHAASLSSLGYRVTVACDPRSAITLFSERPGDFDCVLLDQRMPELTGDQVAVQLLRYRPDIPIVICSGFSDSLSLKSAQDLGIRDVIMKPIIAAELGTTLRRAMSRSGTVSSS